MNRLNRVKGAGFRFIICLGFILFFAANSSANNVPPSPTNSFYGDATGDMIIDVSDIAQAKAWTLGLSYTYDTIQPAAPTQSWNTSDITSDILIDVSDLSALKSWTLGFSVTIPDKPWVLSNENLPLFGNPPATPIAFQINLASNVGTAFGRSGIPIVARIDAAGSTTTGSLVGRTCSPIAGSRDQSSLAGDQCAISVTVTDWYGAPGATKGLTETGTYGFELISNGGGTMRIVFSIDSYPPGLDIPAVSIAVNTNILGPDNLPPTFTSTGPTTARQGLAYSYTPTITDPDTGQNLSCSLGTLNTCGGTLPADTPGPKPHPCTSYTFTPGAGLQTCQFRIVATDNGAPAATAGQTTTVTINRKPTWSTAPTNITGVPLGYTRAPAADGIATDVDVPAQILTCSSSGTSCPFTPTVTGSSTSPTSCLVGFTATLTVQTCNLRIVVTDNGSPAATLGATITITTVNNPPTFTSTGGTTGAQGVLYSYTAATTDADTGENLTCTLGVVNTCAGALAADTPGVKPHNCTAYTFTPGAALQTCQFRLVVTDNGVPARTAGQTTTVTINRNPVWSTLPADITITGSSVYNKTNGTATDPDTPAQALTCSKVGSDTCAGFDVTVSGSGSGSVVCNVSFTAGAYYQKCSFDMRVSDGTLTTTTRTVNITVNALKNWTIMVYMDGDNNLEPAAIGDFNEMEKGLADAIAAGNTDIQDAMNIIVIIDRIPGEYVGPTEEGGSDWTDSRLYRVLPDSTTTDPYFRSERLDDGGVGTGHGANLGEVNMGDPALLNGFINYSKTYFPAAHYALIIWNHGGGTRAPGDDPPPASIKEVASDDTSSDVLYLDEVWQAVAANFDSSNKLSILGFDACLMGMVEVAYEFRYRAEYMVGSMHTEQGDGWDYDYIFSNLTSTRDDSLITARNLSILLVEQYREFIENTHPGESTGETLAAIDITYMFTLFTYINTLAVQIDAANKKTAIESLRDASVHFYDSDLKSIDHPFYDLYDFCLRIYSSS